MEEFSRKYGKPSRKNIVHLSFVLNAIGAKIAMDMIHRQPGFVVKSAFREYIGVVSALYKNVNRYVEVDFNEDYKESLEIGPVHDTVEMAASAVCEGVFACSSVLADMFGDEVPDEEDHESVKNHLFLSLLFIKNVIKYYESDKSQIKPRPITGGICWN